MSAPTPEQAVLRSLVAAALQMTGRHVSSSPEILAFSRGPDADVARLLLPDDGRPGPRHVVVKRHLDGPAAGSPARDRAANESAALTRLEGLDPAGLVATPRLLGHDAERSLVLMEAAEGRSLQGLVRAARWPGSAERAAALAGLRLAGEFLRRMAALPPPEAHASARLLEEVRGDARQCVERGLGSGRVERLRALAEAPPAPGPSCWSHGDFWPGNVLVATREDAPATATVIDLEGMRTGVAGEDAANFLEHLALLLPWRRLRRPFEQALLGGAAEPGAPLRAAKLLRLAARAPGLAGSGLRPRILAARLQWRMDALARQAGC